MRLFAYTKAHTCIHTDSLTHSLTHMHTNRKQALMQQTQEEKQAEHDRERERSVRDLQDVQAHRLECVRSRYQELRRCVDEKYARDLASGTFAP